MPIRFSPAQIGLHWLTALLVLVQFLNDHAIGRAFRATMRRAAEIPGGWLVTAHVVIGVAIFVFAFWRIALRLKRGAPPAPIGEPRALQRVAAATHGLLYGLLVLLPLSGLVAWFGAVGPAAEVHELLKSVLLAVIALHVAGTLYQQFVLRSGVVARMLPGRGAAR